MRDEDKTLIQNLRSWGYGPKDLKPLEQYFDTMHLPLPGPGEFYGTTDRGAIVFLSATATAMRISHKAYTDCEHPRILRPFLRRPIGEQLVADINPGVFTPFAHTKDYTVWGPIYRDQIEVELDAANIASEDMNGCNAGVLPAPFGKYHLLIDPGSLKKVYNGGAKPVYPKHDPQQKVFGPTAELFAQAWPSEQKTPDYSQLKAAWQTCSAMKAAKTLVAMWETFSYGNSKWAAQKYTETHGLQHALPA